MSDHQHNRVVSPSANTAAAGANASPGAPKSVYLETFGCQMNELDSELVKGRLNALGYRFQPEPAKADVVLYNTCSVRDLAEQKVRSRLGQMARRKKDDPSLIVGVLGCMAERDGENMFRQFPVVDILCGPGELDKLPTLLDNATKTRLGQDAVSEAARAVALQGDNSRRTSTLAAAQDDLELLDLSRSFDPDGFSSRSAYVRITRGCNKFCTYCVVPHTRGAETHRPPEHIIDECKKLADAGVIEITLLGQTVNHYRFEHGAAVTIGGVVQPQKGRTYKGSHNRDAYGLGVGGERVTTFADLLRRIHEEVPAIERLRFVTSYPKDFGDDVMEVIRDSPRICRYLHCPVQSGSDTVLARMNRGYTVGEYEEWVDRARQYLHEPEKGRPLTIAGDIIVGFPGETDEDYQLTKALLTRIRFKNNFIFKYSPRPGTTAYDRIPDDVPEETKKWRCNDLMALQMKISDEISREHVGMTMGVFVEGLSKRQRVKEKAAVDVLGSGACSTNSNGAISLTVGGAQVGGAQVGGAQVGTAGKGAEQTQALAAKPTVTSDPVDSTQVVDGEAPAEAGTPQLSGRTDGDLIVVFDCPQGKAPDDLVGSVVQVRVDDAFGLTLAGDVV